MLKLQQAPTFTKKVDIPLPDGNVARVECVFRWMHTKDLRDFLSKVHASQSLTPWAMRVSQAVVWVAKRIGAKEWAHKREIPYRTDYDYLSAIIESWDGVDLPWGPQACDLLLKQYPQAAGLILGAWAKGLTEGRLGN